MQDYAPVAAPLPAALSLPQDVIDDVVVGTVNPNTQSIADAVQLQQDISNAYARVTVRDGNVAAGDLFLFENPVVSTPGIVVGPSQLTFAKAGFYLISFGFTVSKDDIAQRGANVIQTGPLARLLGAACFAKDAATACWLSGSGLIEIDFDGREIFLEAAGTGDDYVVSGPDYTRTLTVTRVR